jgi:hypothetical protein
MNRRAWHAFAGCGVAIIVAGTMALVTGLPWLFPSLGPTAMLQTEQPTSDSSTPRNTLIGHAVALGAGYGSLLLFNLQTASPAPTAGMSASRVGAAALSLAVTAAVLLLIRRPHAPAGATTLIVSLGLLHTPVELLVAFASVAAVTAVDWTYNRLTGEPMPPWGGSPRTAAQRS